MGQGTVRFLNLLTRLRRSRCRPQQLLLLLPSCLQNSECPQKVISDTANCRRCGRCRIKDLLELAEGHGCRCAVVKGGRLALEIAEGDGIEAIVAVACEKELRAGMWAVFPKPGVGVINLRPSGPCKDTDVEVSAVDRAIRRFLR